MSDSKKKRKSTIFFIAINFAVPLIGFIIGVYIPSNKLETAIISLFAWCVTNLIILVYEVQTMKAEFSEKSDEMAKNVHDALLNFRELGDILTMVKNPDAKGYLKSMSELHNGLAHKTNFLITNNLLLKYLVKHHMNNYVNALNGALTERSLPLASLTRMRAAAEAIENAKTEILAVSANNDKWLHASVDSHYFSSNIAKANKVRNRILSKLFTFKRIYILNNELELELKELQNLLNAQKQAHINVRYIIAANAKKHLENSDVYDPLVNILICDNKVLAHSTNDSIHEGYLILDKNKIDRYREIFDIMWGNATDIP
jgi:hypothetical protein